MALIDAHLVKGDCRQNSRGTRAGQNTSFALIEIQITVLHKD